ncbi:MAG: signal peptidase I [Thermacetogeniaceae bacterium]|nr:signal peptidase I [Thermoanaerobacterales bacterium]NLN21291.1 signal peptidase I [Syntrophomonadaceae bacterium]HAF17192.1 signal peptidase I [Peptococcaceae bacterium]
MSQEQEKYNLWKDILQAVVLAIILATVIRVWLLEPFFIPSPSMEPTLFPGDRIIVNKIGYKFREPERGDVIVFHYPLDPERDFVKRVIAFEGETIEIRNNYVYIDGQRLEEPYIPDVVIGDFEPVRVPKGHYFVMGDNRNNSEDSREWGPLDKDLLIGKAIFIYWPFSRFGAIE